MPLLVGRLLKNPLPDLDASENMQKLLASIPPDPDLAGLQSISVYAGGIHVLNYFLAHKISSKETLCPRFEINWDHPETLDFANTTAIYLDILPGDFLTAENLAMLQAKATHASDIYKARIRRVLEIIAEKKK